MAGPLEGVTVIELGVWVAGPAAGGILADWGADVVKIEPPSGDPARSFGRMLGIAPDDRFHLSPPFQMDNRGKRSVVLDLAQPEAQATARELIAGADVFLTNIRVGALRRIGLDFDALAAANPRLVYGLISGYGLDGPDADRPAYDVAAFWARSGLAHMLSRPGDTPPFQRGGMGDHVAGMTLAGAICAALVARARTGAGQLVSTSLYRQGAYTVSFDLTTFLLTGHTIAIGQRETMANPCMNNYTAADGRRFWLVGLQGDRHWPALCAAVNRLGWLTDERYATARARAAQCADLIAELDSIFVSKTLDEWSDIFATQPDLFWSPINSIDEVVGDDQFHAAGGVVYVPDAEAGAVPMVATPADFHGTPGEVRWAAPELGEHTEEVLVELAARAQGTA